MAKLSCGEVLGDNKKSVDQTTENLLKSLFKMFSTTSGAREHSPKFLHLKALVLHISDMLGGSRLFLKLYNINVTGS